MNISEIKLNSAIMVNWKVPDQRNSCEKFGYKKTFSV